MHDTLKRKNGYTESPKICKDCRSFSADFSTDNFGPGDLCIRNPDIAFQVRPLGVCHKWELKVVV